MRNSLCAAAVVALGMTACASAPEPAPSTPAAAEALDPVGTYTFNTTVQGMSVTGEATIEGSDGRWTGSLYSDGTGELPIRSVSVSGRQIMLIADSPDGPVRIRMLMEGETFTGGWSLGSEGGSLRGRRVSH